MPTPKPIPRPPTGFVNGAELVSWPAVVRAVFDAMGGELPGELRYSLQDYLIFEEDGRKFWARYQQQDEPSKDPWVEVQKSDAEYRPLLKLWVVLRELSSLSCWLGYGGTPPIPTYQTTRALFPQWVVWRHFSEYESWWGPHTVTAETEDKILEKMKTHAYGNPGLDASYWTAPRLTYQHYGQPEGETACAVFIPWGELQGLLTRIPDIKGDDLPRVSQKVKKRYMALVPLVARMDAEHKRGQAENRSVVTAAKKQGVTCSSGEVSTVRTVERYIYAEIEKNPHITDDDLSDRLAERWPKYPVLQFLVSDLKKAFVRTSEKDGKPA